MLSKKERQAAFDKWLESLAPGAADFARQYFPGVADCYRVKLNSGHYWLYCLNAFSGRSVTCLVVHGNDSYAPGQVVEVPLTDLEVCDCGKYEPPEYMTLVVFATPHVVH